MKITYFVFMTLFLCLQCGFLVEFFVLFQKQSSGSKAKKHSKSSYQLPNSSRSEGLIFVRYDFESHVLPGYLEGECLFSSAGNNSFGHL